MVKFETNLGKLKPCLKTNQQQSHPPNAQYVLALSTVVLPSVEPKHTDIKCLFHAVNTSYPKAEMKPINIYQVLIGT